MLLVAKLSLFAPYKNFMLQSTLHSRHQFLFINFSTTKVFLLRERGRKNPSFCILCYHHLSNPNLIPSAPSPPCKNSQSCFSERAESFQKEAVCIQAASVGSEINLEQSTAATSNYWNFLYRYSQSWFILTYTTIREYVSHASNKSNGIARIRPLFVHTDPLISNWKIRTELLRLPLFWLFLQ